MSSATKRLEQFISQVEAIQEYPLSAFSDIRRITIPKDQSQSGAAEVKVSVILPGRAAITVIGVPNKLVSSASIVLVDGDVAGGATIKSGGSWDVLIDREFVVGENTDNEPFWGATDKSYKKPPTQDVQVKLRRVVQEVAQRYLNRVSTVDKF